MHSLDRAREALERLEQTAHEESERYAGGRLPLGGYTAVVAAYLTALGTFAVLLGRSRRKPPERIAPGDFLLLAVATHKVSRIVAKDAIMSPLRAPFTRSPRPAGGGELNEQVRGDGLRKSAGELLSCPFCLDVWLATVFVGGYLVAPRATRWIATIFSTVAVSDAMQFAYDALKQTETRRADDAGV